MMSKPPFCEVFNLVLRLADDDLNESLIEPCRLCCQLLRLLFKRGAIGLVTHRLRLRAFRVGSCSDRRRLCLPPWNDQLEHPGAGDLVNANQHRLARFPAGRTALDEIGRNLVKPFIRGDDLVVLP